MFSIQSVGTCQAAGLYATARECKRKSRWMVIGGNAASASVCNDHLAAALESVNRWFDTKVATIVALD